MYIRNLVTRTAYNILTKDTYSKANNYVRRTIYHKEKAENTEGCDKVTKKKEKKYWIKLWSMKKKPQLGPSGKPIGIMDCVKHAPSALNSSKLIDSSKKEISKISKSAVPQELSQNKEKTSDEIKIEPSKPSDLDNHSKENSTKLSDIISSSINHHPQPTSKTRDTHTHVQQQVKCKVESSQKSVKKVMHPLTQKVDKIRKEEQIKKMECKNTKTEIVATKQNQLESQTKDKTIQVQPICKKSPALDKECCNPREQEQNKLEKKAPEPPTQKPTKDGLKTRTNKPFYVKNYPDNTEKTRNGAQTIGNKSSDAYHKTDNFKSCSLIFHDKELISSNNNIDKPKSYEQTIPSVICLKEGNSPVGRVKVEKKSIQETEKSVSSAQKVSLTKDEILSQANQLPSSSQETQEDLYLAKEMEKYKEICPLFEKKVCFGLQKIGSFSNYELVSYSVKKAKKDYCPVSAKNKRQLQEKQVLGPQKIGNLSSESLAKDADKEALFIMEKPLLNKSNKQFSLEYVIPKKICLVAPISGSKQKMDSKRNTIKKCKKSFNNTQKKYNKPKQFFVNIQPVHELNTENEDSKRKTKVNEIVSTLEVQNKRHTGIKKIYQKFDLTTYDKNTEKLGDNERWRIQIKENPQIDEKYSSSKQTTSLPTIQELENVFKPKIVTTKLIRIANAIRAKLKANKKYKKESRHFNPYERRRIKNEENSEEKNKESTTIYENECTIEEDRGKSTYSVLREKATSLLKKTFEFDINPETTEHHLVQPLDLKFYSIYLASPKKLLNENDPVQESSNLISDQIKHKEFGNIQADYLSITIHIKNQGPKKPIKVNMPQPLLRTQKREHKQEDAKIIKAKLIQKAMQSAYSKYLQENAEIIKKAKTKPVAKNTKNVNKPKFLLNPRYAWKQQTSPALKPQEAKNISEQRIIALQNNLNKSALSTEIQSKMKKNNSIIELEKARHVNEKTFDSTNSELETPNNYVDLKTSMKTPLLNMSQENNEATRELKQKVNPTKQTSGEEIEKLHEKTSNFECQAPSMSTDKEMPNEIQEELNNRLQETAYANYLKISPKTKKQITTEKVKSKATDTENVTEKSVHTIKILERVPAEPLQQTADLTIETTVKSEEAEKLKDVLDSGKIYAVSVEDDLKGRVASTEKDTIKTLEQATVEPLQHASNLPNQDPITSERRGELREESNDLQVDNANKSTDSEELNAKSTADNLKEDIAQKVEETIETQELTTVEPLQQMSNLSNQDPVTSERREELRHESADLLVYKTNKTTDSEELNAKSTPDILKKDIAQKVEETIKSSEQTTVEPLQQVSNLSNQDPITFERREKLRDESADLLVHKTDKTTVSKELNAKSTADNLKEDIAQKVEEIIKTPEQTIVEPLQQVSNLSNRDSITSERREEVRDESADLLVDKTNKTTDSEELSAKSTADNLKEDIAQKVEETIKMTEQTTVEPLQQMSKLSNQDQITSERREELRDDSADLLVHKTDKATVSEELNAKSTADNLKKDIAQKVEETIKTPEQATVEPLQQVSNLSNQDPITSERREELIEESNDLQVYNANKSIDSEKLNAKSAADNLKKDIAQTVEERINTSEQTIVEPLQQVSNLSNKCSFKFEEQEKLKKESDELLVHEAIKTTDLENVNAKSTAYDLKENVERTEEESTKTLEQATVDPLQHTSNFSNEISIKSEGGEELKKESDDLLVHKAKKTADSEKLNAKSVADSKELTKSLEQTTIEPSQLTLNLSNETPVNIEERNKLTEDLVDLLLCKGCKTIDMKILIPILVTGVRKKKHSSKKRTTNETLAQTTVGPSHQTADLSNQIPMKSKGKKEPSDFPLRKTNTGNTITCKSKSVANDLKENITVNEEKSTKIPEQAIVTQTCNQVDEVIGFIPDIKKKTIPTDIKKNIPVDDLEKMTTTEIKEGILVSKPLLIKVKPLRKTERNQPILNSKLRNITQENCTTFVIKNMKIRIIDRNNQMDSDSDQSVQSKNSFISKMPNENKNIQSAQESAFKCKAKRNNTSVLQSNGDLENEEPNAPTGVKLIQLKHLEKKRETNSPIKFKIIPVKENLTRRTQQKDTEEKPAEIMPQSASSVNQNPNEFQNEFIQAVLQINNTEINRIKQHLQNKRKAFYQQRAKQVNQAPYETKNIESVQEKEEDIIEINSAKKNNNTDILMKPVQESEQKAGESTSTKLYEQPIETKEYRQNKEQHVNNAEENVTPVKSGAYQNSMKVDLVHQNKQNNMNEKMTKTVRHNAEYKKSAPKQLHRKNESGEMMAISNTVKLQSCEPTSSQYGKEYEKLKGKQEPKSKEPKASNPSLMKKYPPKQCLQQTAALLIQASEKAKNMCNLKNSSKEKRQKINLTFNCLQKTADLLNEISGKIINNCQECNNEYLPNIDAKESSMKRLQSKKDQISADKTAMLKAIQGIDHVVLDICILFVQYFTLSSYILKKLPIDSNVLQTISSVKFYIDDVQEIHRLQEEQMSSEIPVLLTKCLFLMSNLMKQIPFNKHMINREDNKIPKDSNNLHLHKVLNINRTSMLLDQMSLELWILFTKYLNLTTELMETIVKESKISNKPDMSYLISTIDSEKSPPIQIATKPYMWKPIIKYVQLATDVINNIPKEFTMIKLPEAKPLLDDKNGPEKACQEVLQHFQVPRCTTQPKDKVLCDDNTIEGHPPLSNKKSQYNLHNRKCKNSPNIPNWETEEIMKLANQCSKDMESLLQHADNGKLPIVKCVVNKTNPIKNSENNQMFKVKSKSAFITNVRNNVETADKGNKKGKEKGTLM